MSSEYFEVELFFTLLEVGSSLQNRNWKAASRTTARPIRLQADFITHLFRHNAAGVPVLQLFKQRLQLGPDVGEEAEPDETAVHLGRQQAQAGAAPVAVRHRRPLDAVETLGQRAACGARNPVRAQRNTTV